jgi:hypothetical protein
MLKKATTFDMRMAWGDSPMAWEPDYLTLEEFKHFARIPADDTNDDAELELAITDASRAVDACVSERPNGMGAFRQFGQVALPEARYFTPRWDTRLVRWVAEIDDLMDATGITCYVDLDRDDIHESEITVFVLRPLDSPVKTRPYTQIAVGSRSGIQPTYWPDSMKITARWGWTSVPSAVKEATALQAHRFFKRRVAPFGVTGSPNTSTSNNERRLLAKADPDVERSLRSYMRLGWTM